MTGLSVRRGIRAHPRVTTLGLTLIGYGFVIGTFTGHLPIYPAISEAGVDLLSHTIAVVNTLATICLVLGWYWIRRGKVRRHRRAMLTAFALITLFLALYLPKVGGGGEKHFVLASSYAWVPLWDWIQMAYLVMLAIHIVLSVLAVPLVVYAVLLGLTHAPRELPTTPHPTVGRAAAAIWVVSLVLGVITYLLLNHVYVAEFVPAIVLG